MSAYTTTNTTTNNTNNKMTTHFLRQLSCNDEQKSTIKSFIANINTYNKKINQLTQERQLIHDARALVAEDNQHVLGTKDGFSTKYCADKFDETQRELIENFNKAYKKAVRTEKATSKWFDKMCQSETNAIAIDNAFALNASLGDVASFNIEGLNGYCAKPLKRTKLSDEEKAANKIAKLNRKAAARAFVKSVDADTRKKWHMDLGFSEEDAEALKNDIKFWISNTIGVWDITSNTHIPQEWAHIKHVPRKSKKTTQENDSSSD
tara:strand:+ start:333 stop:1124 length:792 start_codon:yes stop_codon:yes gene_type:complete